MSRELLEPAAVTALERQLLSAGGSIRQSKPSIQPVGASPLLSQLRQFMPKMQQANEELQQKLKECDPSELDIEHIPEQEGGSEGEAGGPVIQMDLACGLLELHDDAAVAAAQRAIAAGAEVAVEAYDGGSSGDTDTDTDSGSDSDSSGSKGCENDDADAAGGGSGPGECGVSSSGAAEGGAAAATTAAAAAGADLMDEDTGGHQTPTADVGAPAAASADAQQSEQEQRGVEQQQQQQQGKQRRRLKPRRPMIVEL